MPGSLEHSPAVVIRQLLVDLGHCSDPSSDGSWPAYATQEPDRPDSCVTVYDTTGRTGVRSAADDERPEYNGVQIRLRCASYETGWAKARTVAKALDDEVSKTAVSVSDQTGTGTSTYVVWSVRRTSDVLTLGKAPNSVRYLFTINAEVSLRQSS